MTLADEAADIAAARNEAPEWLTKRMHPLAERQKQRIERYCTDRVELAEEDVETAALRGLFTILVLPVLIVMAPIMWALSPAGALDVKWHPIGTVVLVAGLLTIFLAGRSASLLVWSVGKPPHDPRFDRARMLFVENTSGRIRPLVQPVVVLVAGVWSIYLSMTFACQSAVNEVDNTACKVAAESTARTTISSFTLACLALALALSAVKATQLLLVDLATAPARDNLGYWFIRMRYTLMALPVLLCGLLALVFIGSATDIRAALAVCILILFLYKLLLRFMLPAPA